MMSVEVDETAGDLPVRDVGLMRGGLMPTAADSVRDVKPWKKSHILKMKDPQRLFKVPREQLEEHCLRLIEENGMLRQHAIAQEQKIRRMSTRLMRLQQARPGETAASARETDMDETIQELEARVSKLEGQKRALQNKLQLARQHIMDMGGRTHYRLSKGRGLDGEGAVRRAAQTAPPRYGPALEDTRDNERFRASVMETQQSRVAELELAALRDTLRERDREMEGAMKDMRKQQADMHRQSIKENVDVIRLQKQLSERSAALRVAQDKLNHLQKTYENQLEECQRSLKETNASLLEKVEELSVQLKEERQRGLSLETNLNTANLSQKTLEQFKDRISDLEGERALLKESYDALLDSTFSAKTQQHHPTKASSKADRLHQGRQSRTSSLSLERGKDLQRLEEMLRGERDERHRLEEELDRLREQRRENKGGVTEERRDPNRASFHSEVSMLTRDKRHLEQELEQYREQVVALQDRLDSIPKEFEMSIEELSETLLQIKVFRMQQESRDALRFLRADRKARGGAGGEDEPPLCVADLEASLAETSLELSKTRELLLLQHRIHNQLQEEINVANQRLEREKEESRRRLTEKDKLLAKRILQINTLQAQLKDMAYSPAHYKRTMPVQYTWLGAEQEVVPPVEDDAPFSQLRPGEALLEIHLKGATFTPEGLRTMALVPAGRTTDTETLMEEALEMDRRVDAADDMVTFCTYGLLDFEVHSTPLVSGATPNYGFTSRYALAARDLGRLGGQGARARLELHQATGGVRFVTRGGAHLPLMGAVERRGERVGGCVNVTGSEGEMVGVVDFWVRLHPPAEALMMDTLVERGPDRVTDRRAATQRTPTQQCVGWEDSTPHEVRQQFDYGVGIPNELLVVLERCVGLQARWPGLLPDAYLTYRLYDLPPHTSPTAQCAADPLFNDATTYPLAVTKDLLHYLRSGSLWVYLFDDSDEQTPPAYLAKTPVPLVALATGKEIRGDYVLRDAGGAPQGMLRMLIKWRYPFQTAEGAIETHRGERRAKRREDAEETLRPIAKPRLKKQVMETTSIQKETKAQSKSRPPPIKVRRPQEDPGGILSVTSPATPSKKRSPKRSPEKGTPRRLRAALSHTTLSDISQVSMDEEQDGRHSAAAAADSETSGSTTSSSTQSDIVVIPTKPAFRKGDKLRVEILSLTFGPSSNVALDQTVQRVYVEYRLLGVPMETTETPMSLRKPEDGEEIHYNFTRVIYVDGTEAAPLRQYLYTMLEGTDPSQGRLKFTVVSEPMDEEEECVDVGHSFLELQELLLTGNDVSERQIDILSVDEDREVIGQLKVSLEAAKALTGIYWEFQQQKDDVPQQAQETLEEEEEEEGKEEEEEEEKGEQPQAIVEEDSDYY